MNIKKLYYYWFYKYYSFLEKYEQTRWLSQTKAIIIMGALEIWVISSVYSYVKLLLFKRPDKFSLGIAYLIIPTCLIIIIKWLAFNDDSWKEYVKEFDAWDSVRNNRGTWIVAIVTLVIFFNFLFSGVLLRQMYGWQVW